MVAIPLLLYEAPLPGGIDAIRVGTVLIWVAAVLTLWSMAYYLRRAQRAHHELSRQGQPRAP
jgi:phosphatidylglycerophosphate synthase